MKKVFLIAILFILVASCSKKEFKSSDLIGTWSSIEIYYEEGVECTTIFTYSFGEQNILSMETLFYAGEDLYCTIKGTGDYELSGDILKISLPSSNLEISLDRDFFDSKYEYKQALKELRSELSEDEESWEEKIISISSSKLILEADGEKTEFEKQ